MVETELEDDGKEHRVFMACLTIASFLYKHLCWGLLRAGDRGRTGEGSTPVAEELVVPAVVPRLSLGPAREEI